MAQQSTVKRRKYPRQRISLWLALLVITGLLFACTPADAPAPANQDGAAAPADTTAPEAVTTSPAATFAPEPNRR